MIEGYTTVKEIAEKWGLTSRTVQILCAEGKIKGVTKFGKAWAIPKDAEKPNDRRKSKRNRNIAIEVDIRDE